MAKMTAKEKEIALKKKKPDPLFSWEGTDRNGKV